MTPEHRQDTSKANKIPGTSSSHVQKETMVKGEKTWSAPMFVDQELPWGIPNNTSSIWVDVVLILSLFLF